MDDTKRPLKDVIAEAREHSSKLTPENVRSIVWVMREQMEMLIERNQELTDQVESMRFAMAALVRSVADISEAWNQWVQGMFPAVRRVKTPHEGEGHVAHKAPLFKQMKQDEA